MAIRKEKLLANGVTGEYWKITKVNVNNTNNKVTFLLSLFLDQAHSSGQPILSNCKKYEFTYSSEELAGNIIQLGYSKILEKAETMVFPLFGRAGDALITFDEDLAGGDSV